MEPKIGMIVMFTVEEQDKKVNNFQSHAPAMITNVFGNDLVNLKVFLDGESSVWRTSCKMGFGEGQWHFSNTQE